MHRATLALFCLLTVSFCFSAKAQTSYKKPHSKVLAVSGGGARGAWGLGVVEQLVEQGGAYRAVFGTSTGSLMAPMVLLQQFDKLKTEYTSVTQKKIFNKNPFKVKMVNDTPKAQLKSFNAIWRLITGKPTLGESENLRDLIEHCFTPDDFALLKQLYATDSLALCVAVTNLTSGRGDIKSSEKISDYQEMVNWIWASANTPIFMSNVTINDSVYVDGGLREIVPLRAAVTYAIKHGIDTVEVVMNDSQQALDTMWNISKKQNKGYFNGLLRVLAIYNANTEFYNLWSGAVLTELHDVSIEKDPGTGKRDLTIIIYSMPYGLSMTYRDDLAFDKVKMTKLLDSGTYFIKNKSWDKDTRQVYRAKRVRE